MDKRVERSKQKIRDGLIVLLRTTPLSEVTVSALCKQAGVNRSTFYVHYNNVMDCFEEITDEILDRMTHIFSVMSEKTVDNYVNVYFNTARENYEVFRAIHTTDIHNPMIGRMVNLFNEYLHYHLYIPKDTGNLRYSYLFYGFYGMAATWLQNGCKETNEELISILHEIEHGTL